MDTRIPRILSAQMLTQWDDFEACFKNLRLRFSVSLPVQHLYKFLEDLFVGFGVFVVVVLFGVFFFFCMLGFFFVGWSFSLFWILKAFLFSS